MGEVCLKIKNQLPKVSEPLHAQLVRDGWMLLKEPNNMGTSIFTSVPFMFLNAIFSIVIINMFSKFSFPLLDQTSNVITIHIDFIFIVGLFLLIIVHELLHLIFVPNFFRSDKTYLGFTPFGCFVYTEEEIYKAWYIFITLVPFIVLSVLFPIILGIFGLLTPTLITLILINAIGSSVDTLTFVFVVRQVPKHAILRSNGTKTYWKVV